MSSGDQRTLEFRIRGNTIRLSWPRAIFILGVALFGVLLVETILIWVLAPDLLWPILRGIGAEITTGREGGIPVFLEGGVPPLLTMQYSFTQDLMTSFLVYPLFLYLLDRYHDRDNFFMRRVRKIEDSAEKHEGKVRRFGAVFLFFFMLLPFMVNGPLVGLMLGRLAGIRMPLLIGLVAAATLLPSVAWTLFYDTLFALVSTIIPGGPKYITIGVVGFILLLISGSFVWDQVQTARRRRSGGGEDEEDDDGERSAGGAPRARHQQAGNEHRDARERRRHRKEMERTS